MSTNVDNAGLCTVQPCHPDRRSFFIVAATNMTLLIGATLPTPLYTLYRSAFALTPIDVTIIYAAYAFATIPMFFVFGPIGDKIGRKRVLTIAVTIAIISTLFFIAANGLILLVIGRIGQGIAVGAASGNATAALVELEPNQNRRRASQIAGTSLFAGIVLGPLAAGLFAQYLPAPTLLVYIIYLALLIVILTLILRARESKVWPKPGPYRFHKPSVPSNIRLIFGFATLTASLSFVVTGLYFSLIPSYAETLLGSSNVAIGGAIPSVLVFVSLITQLVMWNLNHTKLMIVGQLCLTAGLAFLALAYFIPSLIIIFLSAIISGVAVGTTFLGGLGTINTISPATRRGDVTSSFYAVGYSALGFPIVLLGFTVQLLNIFVGVQIFAIIIGAIAVPNMIWIAAHKKLFQRAAESTS